MSDPFAPPGTDPLARPDGGSTAVLENPILEEVEAGDHERFAHYVAKEKIVESAVTGTPVIALCGYLIAILASFRYARSAKRFSRAFLLADLVRTTPEGSVFRFLAATNSGHHRSRHSRRV